MTEPLTTITYIYGNEAWGDLLTAYNGSNIFYDGAGNPTSYLNGLKFNWTQGRQLSRVYTIRGTVATYQYDTEGIRIGKNVGGVSTRYFVDASGTMQAMRKKRLLNSFVESYVKSSAVSNARSIIYGIGNGVKKLVELFY